MSRALIVLVTLPFRIAFWIGRGLIFGWTERDRSRRMMRRELRRGLHRAGRGAGDGATMWRGASDVAAQPSLSPFYGRPGYLKILARLATTITTVIVIWAWFTHRAELVAFFRALFLAIATTSLVFAVRHWRTRVRRKRRRALFAATARILQLLPAENHRQQKWLKFNGDECSENGRVRVNVPDDFLAGENQVTALTRLMNDRLPGEWESRNHLDELYLEFCHPPRPPDLALYADYEHAFTGGHEHVMPLGPSDRGVMVTVDLKQDSPHMAIVAGSGGGKSTQLALQVARFLHHGAERVDILDIRRTSQIELVDVPGVRIHRTVEECVSAIAEYRAEVGRRQQITEDAKQREYSGRRWVLAIEEMSTLTEDIRRHWRAIKAKKDPAQPPALDDIAFLSSIGRASKITMLAVMQYGAARMFGGPAAKSNFAAFILLRFRPPAWRLLVGTTPIPASPSAPGRGWVVTGDSERLVQLVLATPEQVVRLATTGANEAADAEPIEPAALAGPALGPAVLPPSGDVRMSGADMSGVGATPAVAGDSGAGWVPDVPPDMPAPDPLAPLWAMLGNPQLPAPPASPHVPPRPAEPPSPAELESTIPTPPPAGPPPAVPRRPDGRPRLEVVRDDRIIGWKAAAEFLGIKQATLERTARRDETFPAGTRAGNQRAWIREELSEWQRNRPIAGERNPPPAGDDKPDAGGRRPAAGT